MVYTGYYDAKEEIANEPLAMCENDPIGIRNGLSERS
jgi:hypothetical protein